MITAALAVAASDRQTDSGRGASAADHKQWMSDAGDLQEDLRDALAAKAAPKVAEAGDKLQKILTQTEQYWAAKHADDVVQLARGAETLNRQMITAAKAGKMDQASDAFTKLGAACNKCHDLHPEKR
jgi:hypothetical protein